MTEDPRIIWSPAPAEQRAQWKSALEGSTPNPELPVTLEHILCRAILSHDFDLVRACLSKEVELNSWVHESVGMRLSLDLVEILMPAGLDVNYNLGRQGYYITIAVRKNDLSLAEYLLQHGADVNKPGMVYQFPAVALAVSNDNAEMVELLIQHGAQIDGSGALGMAAAHGKLKMLDLLLFKYGVDININDNDRKTNHLRFIMKNKDFTALHEAAAAGQVDAVTYLLKHGANADLEAEGRTPVMVAREREHWEVVELLEK
ncbi:ankyrin [Aspergillus campestris IBT 28561]|uniref:Ankyrin n=1 Tax=Aspergillus campestris (strain IBT 28561) TaxID=1392248 RepID=A0A2I1DCC8_ASPC2|nr:ankyrin [Aspergillus campestris IBT 28561]PKY07529.1 ankyrin [Aspergillus campestris IBT 28561]